MISTPIAEVKSENESTNLDRKLEIEARVNLLYEEIDANEEENRGMESEIFKLEKELEKLTGSDSDATKKK